MKMIFTGPYTSKPLCKRYLIRPTQKFYYLLALFWLIPFVSFAQTRVKGSITTSDGKAFPGVSIQVKGSSKAVTSNTNGLYAIEVSNSEGVLVFSHVGMKTQEFPISGRKEINVIMEDDNESLGEVVVVGYGTQRKATVTGAIASISTREVKQSPAANLAITLSGRLPGLTVTQRSGQPGKDLAQLYIRGRGTINAQSPIILVDGVERDLTYIDPNEVESVTILKDASSTAIFGVRGANGVILVTTRRGTSEIPEVNFTAEAGAQSFTRFITPVDSYEFVTLRNLALKNDGLAPSFSDEAVEKFRTGSDPVRYPNTDWRNILMKDYSMQSRYNLNISGMVGKDKAVKYFVNAGYLDQGSQFKTESRKDLGYDPSFNLKRYNFRSNIDLQINKSLKAFLNVAGYLEKGNGPYYPRGSSDASFFVIAYMAASAATAPGPLTPNGQVVSSPEIAVAVPPYGILNRSGYMQETRSNVTATYGMEQSLKFLTEGLSLKGIMSFDARSINSLDAARSFERYIQIVDPVLNGADGQDSVYFTRITTALNTPLSLSGIRNFNSFTDLQGSLNYNRIFNNKHSITGLLLYQQQNKIIDIDLPYNLRGLAGRVSYGYNDKYFAEFNAGYNGSEQFAKGKRFGFFPAVSGAWLISNEDFMKRQKIITHLKLRGSYGHVGNDRIGTVRFLYLDNIQLAAGGYSNSLGGGKRVNISLLKNEDLQWEVAKKANLGFEIGIANSLNLSVDVFKEKRENVLRYRGTIPVLNGFPTSVLSPVNIGVIENKGYEIELNYRKAFTSDFSFLAKLNFNHARNKQIYADELQLPADYAYRYRQTGYSIGQTFGYVVDRYFESVDDVNNSPVQSVGGHVSRPGDFKYKDLNGDGVVNEKDVAPIGFSNVPEYQFGLALSANYKGFDLSVLFQGVTNVNNYYDLPYGTFEGLNYVKRHLESWTEERAANGYDIKYPRLTTQGSPNNINNSFFNVDASYIRLKNLELGYNIPGKIVNKIGMKGIRVYTNGLNLYTWDRLPTKDFDPELTSNRGILAYPIMKIYNFGVNITF